MDKINAQKIKSLKIEIANLKENTTNLERQLELLNKPKKIDSIPGIILYEDRIVGKNRTIKIDSNFIANIERSGEITYTTETKGGGARPTLTRVVAGAYLAGPLGAVIGGTAQKQKKIKTKTTEHDNRSLYVTINSDEGNIEVSLKPDLEAKARLFITNMLNAKIDYPKLKEKNDAERKRLKSEIEKIEKSNQIAKKEKELEDFLANLPPEERKKANTSEKGITLWFIMSIIWLSLFFIPIVPIIFLIISLIKSCNKKKLGIKDGRVTATKIMSIIGISLSALFLFELIVSGESSTNETIVNQTTSISTNKNASKEILMLKKCTVMEWADIVNTMGNINTAFADAKTFCKNNLNSWGKDEFYEAVNYDWKNRKNDLLNGKTLDETLDTFDW